MLKILNQELEKYVMLDQSTLIIIMRGFGNLEMTENYSVTIGSFYQTSKKKEALELRFGSRLDNKDSYDNNIDDETDHELEIYI